MDASSSSETRFERMRPATLVAIAILGGLSFQLLLGTSYVAAFLHPVESSTGLPVGVVNLDDGAHGQELLERLDAADSPIEWVRYDSRDALEAAMREKKAYGGIVVPGDFSEALESFGSQTPRAASLTALANPGASTAGNLVAKTAIDAVLDGVARTARERALASVPTAGLGAGVVSLDQARWLAEPIRVEAATVNIVPEDGANGLAPAYLAMACWVGGYLGSAALERFRGITRLPATRRALIVIGASLLQAALALVALLVIGLRVRDLGQLYLVLAAGTIMAYAVVSLCLDVFGLAGVVPAFAILSIGLPASGALYPVEMLPPLYRALYAADPFTWLVEGLRTALYAPDAGDLATNVGALALTALAATGASLAIVWFRRRRAQPSLV